MYAEMVTLTPTPTLKLTPQYVSSRDLDIELPLAFFRSSVHINHLERRERRQHSPFFKFSTVSLRRTTRLLLQ